MRAFIVLKRYGTLWVHTKPRGAGHPNYVPFTYVHDESIQEGELPEAAALRLAVGEQPGWYFVIEVTPTGVDDPRLITVS